MTIDALAQSSLISETVSRKIINQEKEESMIVQEYSFDEKKGLISGGKARHANLVLLGNKIRWRRFLLSVTIPLSTWKNRKRLRC
ncbi:hypothetical protein [Candidatus Williamhamiltonella defendens]|uniref:hypothetical protein n=1 Tax=Candidatus Williamhamiltonella defendens TaxID=138072 RepID=UPI00165125B8|nr:hypothetical protein [Candidatus Hamiltonella defensa]